MKKYFFIGLGGFLGAATRVVIKGASIFNGTSFPIDTLLINLLGSFLLALLLTLTLDFWKIKEEIKLGLTVGFFGSFTTFSTFSKDLNLLMQADSYGFAFLYLILSIFVGLTLAYLGILLGNKIAKKIIIEEKEAAVC